MLRLLFSRKSGRIKLIMSLAAIINLEIFIKDGKSVGTNHMVAPY